MSAIKTDAVIVSTVSPVKFSGKGAVKRMAAFGSIAVYALMEALTRGDAIENYQLALGANPAKELIDTSRGELIIGRVAGRLPAGEYPRKNMSDEDKLAFVRDQRDNYAAPPEEGKETGKLPANKKGRRSIVLHKALRAADNWATLFIADAGYSEAEGLKAKNDKAKAKREAHHNAPAPTPAPAAPANAPTVETLAADCSKSKASTSSDYDRTMLALIQGAAGFDKKNAGARPVEWSEVADLIGKLRSAAVKASNAFHERQAKALTDAQAKAGTVAAKEAISNVVPIAKPKRARKAA